MGALKIYQKISIKILTINEKNRIMNAALFVFSAKINLTYLYALFRNSHDVLEIRLS